MLFMAGGVQVLLIMYTISWELAIYYSVVHFYNLHIHHTLYNLVCMY